MRNAHSFIVISTLLSIGASGCLGETNQHLTGVEQNTQVLANEVQKDRAFLQNGIDQAAQMNASLTRATNSLEKAVGRVDEFSAKADAMNANLTAISGSIGSMTKSLDSVSQSVGKLPGAMNQLNENTKVVSAAAAGTEEQAKRIGDNLAVLDAYGAVALKGIKDYADKQDAAVAAAAAQAHPATSPGGIMDKPAPGAQPSTSGLATPTEADLKRIDTSLLSERPKLD